MSTNWFLFGLKPKEKPDGPRYADLYERGLACAADITLLFLLLTEPFEQLTLYIYHRADRQHLLAAQSAPSGFAAFHEAWLAGLPQLWVLNAAIQILIMGLFLVGCQLKWDTTPGKYLLGLSIRRADNLELPSAWQYVARYLGYIPAAPVFFIMSFNKRHRGLHDRMVGTVVIHTRARDWYWQQTKRFYRWAQARLNSPAVEQPVGQPAAAERHGDSEQPE